MKKMRTVKKSWKLMPLAKLTHTHTQKCAIITKVHIKLPKKSVPKYS